MRAPEGISLRSAVGVSVGWIDRLAVASLTPEVRKTVGLTDIPLVFLSPRRLFARVEDVQAYGWVLLVLLTAMALLGYATVETGLIDRAVRSRVLERQAALENAEADVVERSALRKALEEETKKGEFERLMTRIGVVVARPAGALASVLLIAALLYGIVALTGRKPEWHTLMTICVFAAFVDLFATAFRLVLMLAYKTLDVDTSAALLARGMPAPADPQAGPSLLPHLLAGIDPFRIWFWWVVVLGLSVTMQLRGWRAWVPCSLFFLVAGAAQAGLSFAQAAGSA